MFSIVLPNIESTGFLLERQKEKTTRNKNVVFNEFFDALTSQAQAQFAPIDCQKSDSMSIKITQDISQRDLATEYERKISPLVFTSD